MLEKCKKCSYNKRPKEIFPCSKCIEENRDQAPLTCDHCRNAGPHCRGKHERRLRLCDKFEWD